ncbi:helix-turn-helix domain-containing protein [Bradyrhizobium sp. ORS 111]|uniref:helix-turn-helix domain-containing protein n=1 Tax=Bradyrhizobium sp. ORS 111 TaxID=1685958 RepID=UPI00388CF2E2
MCLEPNFYVATPHPTLAVDVVHRERTVFDALLMGSLERQSENPTIDLVGRIADALGVPPSELFVLPAKGAKAPQTLSRNRKPAHG